MVHWAFVNGVVTWELLPNISDAYIFKIIINFLSYKSHIPNECNIIQQNNFNIVC